MKKLVLKKEVVSAMNDDQLSHVVGGGANETQACCTAEHTGCTWRASFDLCGEKSIITCNWTEPSFGCPTDGCGGGATNNCNEATLVDCPFSEHPQCRASIEACTVTQRVCY